MPLPSLFFDALSLRIEEASTKRLPCLAGWRTVRGSEKKFGDS